MNKSRFESQRSLFVLNVIALSSGISLLSCGQDVSQKASLEIRVLTDRTESHLAPIFREFERRFNARVEAVHLDAGLVARLESRPKEADLVITKDAELMELAKTKGLLAPLSSSFIRRAVPEEFRDKDGMYFTDSYRARAIFYSKERVKAQELSTYEALADAKWRGRICLRSGYHDYNLSLLSQLMAVLGRERTEKLIRGLDANLARTPRGNDREQVKGICENRCDIALVNSYYMGIMLSSSEQRAWGESAGVFFPDQESGGSIILRSGLALTRATANVEAATELLEFMAGERSQNLMARLTFAYPVNSRRPLSKINRQLGAGQAGVQNGVFKYRKVPLADTIRQRKSVIEILDEIHFDRPR